MKDVWQCQFGCGTRIRHETVEFSDGLKIRVPREEVGNSVHNCPNLPNIDPHELELDGEGGSWRPNTKALAPTEKEDYDEFVEEQGDAWQKETIIKHFEDLNEDFLAIDGLEFKNIRHSVKKNLVKELDRVPHFFYTINLWGGDEDLPACLQTDDKCYGQFLPVELLGLFYQMDGGLEGLEDAKKCYKILEETGWIKTVGKENQTPSQKIEEMDEWIEDAKQELLIDSDGSLMEPGTYHEVALRKPDVLETKPDDENVKIDNQKLHEEIDQFEEEDLHNLILYKFPGTKLIEKLKTLEAFPKKTTLYEKYEEMLKTEKEKSVLEKQGTPLSYLDFGDKNTIMRQMIKISYWYMLTNIKTRRNDLDHADDTPKELKKARQDDEITLNRKTRDEIHLVKNEFERLKNK